MLVGRLGLSGNSERWLLIEAPCIGFVLLPPLPEKRAAVGDVLAAIGLPLYRLLPQFQSLHARLLIARAHLFPQLLRFLFSHSPRVRLPEVYEGQHDSFFICSGFPLFFQQPKYMKTKGDFLLFHRHVIFCANFTQVPPLPFSPFSPLRFPSFHFSYYPFPFVVIPRPLLFTDSILRICAPLAHFVAAIVWMTLSPFPLVDHFFFFAHHPLRSSS